MAIITMPTSENNSGKLPLLSFPSSSATSDTVPSGRGSISHATSSAFSYHMPNDDSTQHFLEAETESVSTASPRQESSIMDHGMPEFSPKRRPKLSVSFNPADLERPPSRILHHVMPSHNSGSPKEGSPIHSPVPRIGPRRGNASPLPRMRSAGSRNNSISKHEHPGDSGVISAGAFLRGASGTQRPSSALGCHLPSLSPRSSHTERAGTAAEGGFAAAERALALQEARGRHALRSMEQNSREAADDYFQEGLLELLSQMEQRVKERDAEMRQKERKLLLQRHEMLAVQLKLMQAYEAEQEGRTAVCNSEQMAFEGLMHQVTAALLPAKRKSQVVQQELADRHSICLQWQSQLKAKCRQWGLEMEEQECRSGVILSMAEAWDEIWDQFSRGIAQVWLCTFDAQQELQRFERHGRQHLAAEERKYFGTVENWIKESIAKQKEHEHTASKEVPTTITSMKCMPPMSFFRKSRGLQRAPQPHVGLPKVVQHEGDSMSVVSRRCLPPMSFCRTPAPWPAAPAMSCCQIQSVPSTIDDTVSTVSQVAASFPALQSQKQHVQTFQAVDDQTAVSAASFSCRTLLDQPSGSPGTPWTAGFASCQTHPSDFSPESPLSPIAADPSESMSLLDSSTCNAPAAKGAPFVIAKDLRAAFEMDMADGKVDGQYMGTDIVTHVRDPTLGYVAVRPRNALDYQEFLEWEDKACIGIPH